MVEWSIYFHSRSASIEAAILDLKTLNDPFLLWKYEGRFLYRAILFLCCNHTQTLSLLAEKSTTDNHMTLHFFLNIEAWQRFPEVVAVADTAVKCIHFREGRY